MRGIRPGDVVRNLGVNAAAAFYVWSVPSSSTKPRGGVTTFIELENVGPTPIAIEGLTVERK